MGDGGNANDVGTGHPPLGNGQDTSTLLGSILRIDVDNGNPSGIPPDNPFVGQAGRDEVFAYGFRNPFRISFDAGGSHDLFAGDAGQNLWEEVDIVTKGNNYGWNIKEGTHCFDPDNPDMSPEVCSDTGLNGNFLIDPVIEYQNANAPGGLGRVVVGGFLYRGAAMPEFIGRYIFGDWSTSFSQGDGTLFIATPPSSEGELWSMQELRIAMSTDGRIGAFVRSFGQDANRELYVLTSEMLGPTGNTGKVWKIGPACFDFDNGQVDIGDVQAIAMRWRLTAANPDPDGNSATPNYEARFDPDGDGAIAVRDIMAVVAQLGKGCE